MLVITDDTALCIVNPKVVTKQRCLRANSKVVGYKINTLQLNVFLHTMNNQSN